MFSPASRKSHFVPQKGWNPNQGAPDSPSTPVTDIRGPFSGSAVPNRPATGTPAPWTSRLSVLARIPPVKKSDKGADSDQTQPVFVGEFPQLVRNAQASYLQSNVSGDAGISGGIDKGSSLSWIICGSRLFIWSYLSWSVSKKCVVLDIPSSASVGRDNDVRWSHGNYWMISFVKWDTKCASTEKVLGPCNSAGVVAYNQKTQAVVLWPDVFLESGSTPILCQPSCEESEVNASPHEERTAASWSQEPSRTRSVYLAEDSPFNSLIASAIPGSSHECIALACRSNGELWQFHCSSTGIYRKRFPLVVNSSSLENGDNGHPPMIEGYARSLIWHFQCHISEKSSRQFFLLTDHEIQCWNIIFAPHVNVTKLWSHEIVGTDDDLGIKKDLAGQKHIWLLDMQIDDSGKEFTILVATFCKDRVSSSSYTQYSLLTMQYKPGLNASFEDHSIMNEKVLEKKTPLQVIIPKARVEHENFLFSMKLRVGGKPSGSAIVLSGDGTATVTNYRKGSTRLYQFDLPWDAGKVLDASVFPSTENDEEGAWVVLTEKAGIWAIPEKAVLLGGVEPPERSLSRKGSSNEGATEEEKIIQKFGGNIAPRRDSSEVWNSGDRQRAVLSSIAQRTAQDEEAETLLRHLFNDFLLSGEVDGTFEKLKKTGAFEKEGETNVFARMSKSIVDTLAKHWTTTRGTDFVASAVVSSQLLDKQQKHERFLQFLALSKCHEELSSRQRHSLQIILEHGEKLSGMIQLRELQNLLSQSRSKESESSSSHPHNEVAGSLWDFIQLVGEKARRNTVLLMDRDNAEVFYSKVSDLEVLLSCLSHHLQYIIGGDQPFMIQIQRACEISNACISLLHAAMRYRDEHQNWYPPPEGLTPWNCQRVVRSGLWSIASLIMQLLKEASVIDGSVKSHLCSQLEGLADVLLEAYNASITAMIEREEEYKGLKDDYFKRRDEILSSLYQQLKGFVNAKYQDSCKETEDIEMKEAIFREASAPLLLIAKHHEGYQILWNICYDLSDTGLLQTLMHESVGPQGGFSYFVFNQLYESHQYSKLLRLGEEFQEELLTFLKQHKELLWLHELFLNQFSSASESLHALALCQDDGSSMIEKASEHDPSKCEPSLEDRRRFLNISKIAAVAGQDVGFAMKIRRIEADLQILKLQEEIMRQIPDSKDNQDVNRPLHPAELIELCLKGKTRKLSLQSFEVFAWTSSSFRESNRSLLEECWMNAADQNDWEALCQASVTEGWSDEVSLQFLRETVLFQASRRCYGPEAEVYEGGFEEVLPLQKEDAEFTMLKQPGVSVEGILMQHKDFPDAGKLMLTAIVMGKAGADVIVKEDLAMEMR